MTPASKQDRDRADQLAAEMWETLIAVAPELEASPGVKEIYLASVRVAYFRAWRMAQEDVMAWLRINSERRRRREAGLDPEQPN